MGKVAAIAGPLLVVGGLNWGLVALAEFDLVAWVVGEEFGETTVVSRIIYGLVGLSAIALAGSLLGLANRERGTRSRVASGTAS